MRKRADRGAKQTRAIALVWRRHWRLRHEIECRVITLYSMHATCVRHIARLYMDQIWPPRLHFAFSTETLAILWINIVLNKSWYVSVSCSRKPLLNFLCALSLCAPDVWSTQSRKNSVTAPNISVWHFVLIFFHDPSQAEEPNEVFVHRIYRQRSVNLFYETRRSWLEFYLNLRLLNFMHCSQVRMRPPIAITNHLSNAAHVCFPHMKYETTHASVLMKCQMSKIVHWTLSHEPIQHPNEINAKQTKKIWFRVFGRCVATLHLMT